MVIRKEHAQALRLLWDKLQKKEELVSIDEVEENVRHELEVAGIIVYPLPVKMKLTYEGTQLAQLLENLYLSKIDSSSSFSEKEIDFEEVKTPENWPEDWRWVGSEIIALLDAAFKANHVGSVGRKILWERGLAQIVRDPKTKQERWELTSIGSQLYEIYLSLSPQLRIDDKLAEFIRKTPTGPALSSYLPTGSHEEHLLENMRLIAYSVPKSDIFAFTALGQAIKKTLTMGGFEKALLVSEDLMISLEELVDKGETTKEAEVRLMELGYINSQKELLPAGEWLLEAYRLWKEGARKDVWTFAIEEEETEVLKTLKKLWEKYPENPRDNLPNFENLRREMIDKKIKEYKRLLDRYGRKIKEMPQKYQQIAQKFVDAKDLTRWYDENFDLRAVLYALESFSLIRSATNEENKEILKITNIGNQVLEDQEKNPREISSTAVKSITMTRKTFSAPNKEWYDQAVVESLIGTNEPSKSGLFYAKLSETVPRLPFLTVYEMLIFQYIPDKGFTLEDIYKKFEKKIPLEKIKWALEKLEARHLIEILPDSNVIETEAGKLLDKALSGVPSGIKVPVNPLVIRLLQALETVGTFYVKERKVRILPRNIKQAMRLSGLSPEMFKKIFKLAEAAGWIGKASIHESGLTLLKAVELMQTPKEIKGIML